MVMNPSYAHYMFAAMMSIVQPEFSLQPAMHTVTPGGYSLCVPTMAKGCGKPLQWQQGASPFTFARLQCVLMHCTDGHYTCSMI